MKHTLRHLIKNYLCMICASLSLVACSYFDPAEPELDSAWVQDEPVVAKPAPQPVNVADVIARATEGRVQLFGLEYYPPGFSQEAAGQDGVREIAPLNAMEKPSSMMPENGLANYSNSSVQIFPVP